MTDKAPTVTARINAELHQKITEAAQESGRNLNTQLVYMLETFFVSKEALEKEQQAHAHTLKEYNALTSVNTGLTEQITELNNKLKLWKRNAWSYGNVSETLLNKQK